MGYEVDAHILDLYAKILIDFPIDEIKKTFGTTNQKELELQIRCNQKKRVKLRQLEKMLKISHW